MHNKGNKKHKKTEKLDTPTNLATLQVITAEIGTKYTKAEKMCCNMAV